jgi:hypothetical protein
MRIEKEESEGKGDAGDSNVRLFFKVAPKTPHTREWRQNTTST